MTAWQDVPCKIWTGCTTKAGYGLIHRNYKTWPVHRWVWAQEHGEPPSDVDVCHHCDVRACYEGRHLFLGTRKENMADCRMKGRLGERDRHSQAKITRESAKEIRERYTAGGITQRELAAEYGVVQNVVSQVVTGKHWTTRKRYVLRKRKPVPSRV